MTGYGDDLAAIHSGGFSDVAAAAAREVLARLDRPSFVVDLGCGDGTTARLLTDAGHEVLGIDLSPALVALARKRAPAAELRVGSFVDSDLPASSDAVLAVGEVLGYRLDARNDGGVLDRVIARAARALRPGGLMLFDLAGPGRAPRNPQRSWREGDGWAVLVETSVAGRELERRIVSFRDQGGGRFRRAEEIHRLVLHRPVDVLARLRAAGFTARTLPRGYAGEELPRGITAFVAMRR